MFTGCIEKNQKSENAEKSSMPEVQMDQPSILPDWKDGEYHDYPATKQMLNDFYMDYPDLVNVFSIGKSVLNRDIWCIRITNEKNNNDKYSCLIDGCIHGNEWEAGETCLYLAEYLLINFGNNETVTNILNTSNVYIVPLFNPDGRQADERWNENGIDLNRNFDVHFGRLRSNNFPLGKLFGFIKVPMIKHPLRKNNVLGQVSTNCGRHPFSEPETKAIRDLAESLDSKDFSFYVNCHTAMHFFGSIIEVSYKPEYKATKNEIAVLDTVLDWVDETTEYGIFYPDQFSITGMGVANHWVFKEFRIPSFVFEILSPDYDPMYGHGKHDHLVHWMKTTLPVLMYLLVNIKALHDWETPDIEPCLPEGIPPSPL